MSEYKYGSVEYGLLNDKWWDLRLNITSLIFAGGFILARIGSKGLLRLVLSIGVGLSISNVIDRIFFDIQVYTKADILMVIATIIISIYDYVRERNIRIKQETR
jgi:hypothetical protein